MKPREFVRYWVPVIAWMLVIFSASTDLGSAAQTSRFIGPILSWIAPEISAETIALVQLAVRKAAHVVEYAILTMLILRALQSRARATFARLAMIAFAAVALYAATDEFHQSFNASRSGTLQDVAIDCCGALLGVLVYRLLTIRSAPAHALARRTGS